MTDNLPVPDDLPYLNLSQSELDELRKSKKELTEYGKQRLRELMNKDLTIKTNGKETFSIPSQTLENLTLGTKTPETQLEVKEMTHEEMLEIAEKREAENKALAALDELYEKHGDAMLKLAEIEKEEWERRERSDTVLRRYNAFYNEEVSGLPHGTPTSMEQLQCITLECAVDALRCENLNVEYNVIAIDDIKDLIARLYQQSDEFLERVRKLKEQNNE
jgi:hypothetical protein